jgi:hypothetical protein
MAWTFSQGFSPRLLIFTLNIPSIQYPERYGTKSNFFSLIFALIVGLTMIYQGD